MINWGVLGTANIAKKAIIPAIQMSKGGIFKAVASRKIEKTTAFTKLFGGEGVNGYEELLKRPDIDAVYIPLPTGMHYEWVMKALDYGKHILVEKAAVVNLKQAETITQKAKEKGLLLIENFQFQHHSQHKFVLEQIEAGTIGELRAIRSSFGFPPFDLDNNIRYIPALGGGSLLDSGAYTLKVIDFLFGDDFEIESAYLVNHEKFGVDWYGGGQLVNKKQNIFAQVAFGFDNYYQCSYEIWGSKGKITSKRAYTAPPGFQPSIVIETQGNLDEVKLPADNHFENMINYFSNAIIKKEVATFELERQKILHQAKQIETFREIASN